jgi:hypothetical protein
MISNFYYKFTTYPTYLSPRTRSSIARTQSKIKAIEPDTVRATVPDNTPTGRTANADRAPAQARSQQSQLRAARLAA